MHTPITELPKASTEIEADMVALIGRLMVQWSNLESWFIALLAQLLKSDTHRAEIVFYTITTAISRRALLNRVFMTYVADEELQKRFSSLLGKFKAVTAIRNRFAHSQYQFQINNQHMVISSFPNDFDGSTWTEKRSIDKALLGEVKQGILNCLNAQEELFALLKDIEPKISETPIKPLHKHADIP